MKKIKFVSFSTVFALGLASLSGCAELMKAWGGIADQILTQKTSTLSGAAVRAQYGLNLYPKETGLAETAFFGDEWQAGRNAIGVGFAKQHGVGMYSIDGEVTYSTARGETKPMQYLGLGSYWAVLDGDDMAPKTISINTSTGDRMTLQVKPNRPVKIVSINNQTDNPSIDLGADAVVRLQGGSGLPGSKYKVSLISYPLGLATFSDIGTFRDGDTIRIPAAAFRHTSTIGGAGVGSLGAGNNFLRVERFLDNGEQGVRGNAAAVSNMSVAWDTVPVTLTGSAPGAGPMNIVKKGENYSYKISKPNAFNAPPISRAKRLGTASLGVMGRLFDQKSNEYTDYTTGITTKVTTTLVFPELPDGHWDRLLVDLSTRFNQLMASRYRTQFVPLSRVMRASSYDSLMSASNVNSQFVVDRQLNNSKNLMPESLANVAEGVSSTFASGRPEIKMSKELNVDGLVSLQLLAFVSKDQDDHVIMLPVLRFNITGPLNGYMSATSFANGQVSAKGKPFNAEAIRRNPALLADAMNLDALMQALGEGFDALEQQEKEAGYQAIWDMQ